MQLGSYVFDFEPNRLSPVERIKPVGSVATFAGSAVFQWSPFWSGTEITLEWDYMREAQYLSLRILYLSSSVVAFDPDTGGDTYSVIVKSLDGKYWETANSDQPYREDVKMVLEVRSQLSSTTTA